MCFCNPPPPPSTRTIHFVQLWCLLSVHHINLLLTFILISIRLVLECSLSFKKLTSIIITIIYLSTSFIDLACYCLFYYLLGSAFVTSTIFIVSCFGKSILSHSDISYMFACVAQRFYNNYILEYMYIT